MSYKSFIPIAAGVLLLACSAGRPVLAQQAGGIAIEVPEVSNFVAAGVAVIPDYLGSDDYTIGIAPAGLITVGDGEWNFRLVATELSANVINDKTFNFGPVINYRFGRDDDVDDSVVSRLREIDGTLEAGVFGSFKLVGEPDPRQRLIASVKFLHDVTGEHDGYLATASVRVFQPVSRPITLSAGISTTYASEDYTSTYFDVTPGDATRSGLPVFSAGAGMRDISLNAMAIFSLSPSWHLAAGVVYQRLMADAEDSPIVDRRGSANQLYAGVGGAYAW